MNEGSPSETGKGNLACDLYRLTSVFDRSQAGFADALRGVYQDTVRPYVQPFIVADRATNMGGGGYVLFHTMVGSNDIERSQRFYDEVLGVLGVRKAMLNIADSGHTRLFYQSEQGTNFIVTQPINDEPATVANGGTVAFSCNSPEQVKQFHDVAIANGGTSIEAAPGPRTTAAMGTIVLAYVRDPDGNKLCGIHFPQ